MTVGVLGLGSIGIRHGRNLESLGHHVLGFDPSSEAVAHFIEETAGESVDRDNLLARADAIVIAGPNAIHLSDLNDCIAAGKPALVEKPLGHDAKFAEDLVLRARALGVTVAVVQNLRFRSVVAKVRTLLADRTIGTPLWARLCCSSWLPDWRPDKDYRLNYAADAKTGGVIFDAIHELDLAWHLFGPARLASAVARNTGALELDSEDLADIVLVHDGGCQSAIHLDYVTRPPERHLAIGGTEGVLTADLRRGRLAVSPAQGGPTVEEICAIEPNEEYLAVLRNFLTSVQGQGEPGCAAFEAVQVLALACEARAMAGLPRGLAN